MDPLRAEILVLIERFNSLVNDYRAEESPMSTEKAWRDGKADAYEYAAAFLADALEATK